MMKDGKDLKENVNSLSCLVLGGTEVNPQKWTEKIPPELYEVKKRSKYEEKEVFDLVRLIRNKVMFIKHFLWIWATMEPPWGHLGTSINYVTREEVVLQCHGSVTRGGHWVHRNIQSYILIPRNI